MTSSDRLDDWLPVNRLLARHAGRHPSRPAVTDIDRSVAIRFDDLAGVVEGVAVQLHSFGVVRGTRIVLIIDNPIETLIVWLAVWRLAAVVCPFDISQIGATTTQTALNTLQPAMVLHGQRIDVSDILAGTVPCVRFSQWPPQPSQLAAIFLQARPNTDALGHIEPTVHDLASACCTSGSSGRMKIVLHDHAGYWLNGRASIELLGLHEGDRMLDYRSLSWYSPQILTLMPFLRLGLSLSLARQFSSSRFPEWLTQHGITVAAGVPTVLNILLSQPMAHLHQSASGLRVMSSSSAPLATHTWERFEEESGIAVLNLYGSSEGGWICGNRPNQRRVGTVGRAVADLEVHIVDATGAPCPPGVPGEIVIEGPKLALGVLLPDGAVDPIRGTRFATRDQAVRDTDGFVRLLGRIDDLVIRGGVKIAPSEIEDALLTHPAVAEAAAVAIPDPIYGQEAVCFVVLQEGEAAAPAMLASHAAGMLPKEKCPKAICVIDTLPRNARGKLRRDALQMRWNEMAQDAPGTA